MKIEQANKLINKHENEDIPKINSQLEQKVNSNYNKDLENIINKLSNKQKEDCIKHEELLMGMPSKTYNSNKITGTPIISTSGKKIINNASTLTNYIYADNHLVFTSGYPKNKTIEIDRTSTLISNSTNRLEPIQVSLDDNFTIFIEDIIIRNNLVGVKFLLDIDNSGSGYRVRLSDGVLNVEFRKNNASNGALTLSKAIFKENDSFNLVFAKNKNKFTLGVCINNDIDNIFVIDTTKNDYLKGIYNVTILDYSVKTYNLQANCEYGSISFFSRFIPELKSLLLRKTYVKYNEVFNQLTNIQGTLITGDWNERICGEVCNILHEPNDINMPYKIAVGGHKGTYSNSITGKTNFAYSKDLLNWNYISQKPPINTYTEDGCLVRFRGKYYYYAETIPNRNVELWISDDFINWDYVGKVASPDNDESLVGRPNSEVCSGSPTAIVKDNKIYLFVEYGYTSSATHSNRVLVSDDGINFRKLSTIPDILKMENVATILDYPTWTINNFEGICEKDGLFYAWISITNKTVSPTKYKMVEMVSNDLISWEWTTGNFTGEYKYISFARQNDDYNITIEGTYDNKNTYKIISTQRVEEKLPFELLVDRENLIDGTFNTITDLVGDNRWFLTESGLNVRGEDGNLIMFDVAENKGIVYFIGNLETDKIYKLSYKTNANIKVSLYKDNNNSVVCKSIVETLNETEFSKTFKTISGSNRLSIAITGFKNCDKLLYCSDIKLEKIN